MVNIGVINVMKMIYLTIISALANVLTSGMRHTLSHVMAAAYNFYHDGNKLQDIGEII
jgi:hypothetical protein